MRLYHFSFVYGFEKKRKGEKLKLEEKEEKESKI